MPTDPKPPTVEPRHRDAAVAWSRREIDDQFMREVEAHGIFAGYAAAYAIGLAQGEQDGRRMERAALKELLREHGEHSIENGQKLARYKGAETEGRIRERVGGLLLEALHCMDIDDRAAAFNVMKTCIEAGARITSGEGE